MPHVIIKKESGTGKEGPTGKEGKEGPAGKEGKEGKEGPAGPTGPENKTGLIPGNKQTVNYTLIASDAGKCVEGEKATAQKLTLPKGVFAAGESGEFMQIGEGSLEIVGEAGVTIVPTATSYFARARWAIISWRCIETNKFVLAGELL
jgi:hypothetical protein